MSKDEKADIGALCAGVAAVAISMAVAEGEYSVLSIIMSGSLFAIIWAYVFGHQRSWPQELAIALITGMILFPTAAYAYQELRKERPVSEACKAALADPDYLKASARLNCRWQITDNSDLSLIIWLGLTSFAGVANEIAIRQGLKRQSGA